MTIEQILELNGYGHRKSPNCNTDKHVIFRLDTLEEVGTMDALCAAEFARNNPIKVQS